ncbi:MAG: PhnD/SsuA/transferrin family substrate-binding protein [Hyphomicrobiales bacterium]|nr:PhnD/SsuA/transferrin family substrate-binding protein [Hyphomicrobiales bacterium]
MARLGLCLAALCTQASAGWQEDIGTFRVGIVAEPGSGNTIAGLGTLNDAFAKALGVKVEFFVARSYPALIDAQVSSRIDYAVYSAAAYAAAYERCACIEPLVAPTDENGTIGIRSILVTMSGRLASASDLAGRRIALLPPDSMAGHQLPLASFSPNGRRLSGEENFFVSAQSAQSAEAMLADGSVDAIFGWEPAGPPGSSQIEGGTLQRLVAAGVEPQALSVVWRSDVLRFGPHAVSKLLDPEPRQRLADFLTGLRQSDPALYETLETHHLGGFTAASQADYAAALSVVRALAGMPPQQ